ncbi:hypothetical protein RIF29_06284 [Crotalaria pallida]|uniref:Uncharacterized protein n=1 Tax=Crotalaria pallida TaxID=3830 RepID=A0AAN9PAT6_CROPI
MHDQCFPALLTSLTNLRLLRYLYLNIHHFTFVPACITELHSLKELHLSFCNRLVEIRWIPPNLEKLSAEICRSLKYLDLTAGPCLLRTLNLENCTDLEEIRGIPPTIHVLSARNCPSLSDSCRRIDPKLDWKGDLDVVYAHSPCFQSSGPSLGLISISGTSLRLFGRLLLSPKLHAHEVVLEDI